MFRLVRKLSIFKFTKRSTHIQEKSHWFQIKMKLTLAVFIVAAIVMAALNSGKFSRIARIYWTGRYICTLFSFPMKVQSCQRYDTPCRGESGRKGKQKVDSWLVHSELNLIILSFISGNCCYGMHCYKDDPSAREGICLLSPGFEWGRWFLVTGKTIIPQLLFKTVGTKNSKIKLN